jgi:YD repeat-containing protein
MDRGSDSVIRIRFGTNDIPAAGLRPRIRRETLGTERGFHPRRSVDDAAGELPLSGSRRFYVVHGDRIADLSGEAPSLRAALAHWGLDGLRKRAQGGRDLPVAEVAWRPPIADADKILCVGLNYHEHAREAKMAVPDRPSLFVRFGSSQVGHLASVVRPRASHQFDYHEAGSRSDRHRPARHVREADAFSHVAGYSCSQNRCATGRRTRARRRRARTSSTAAPSGRGS